MAFSDWTIVTAGDGAHTAILNSSLSGPLTTGGVYCRRLSATNNRVILRIANAYASGAFVGVPSTRAIRVQAALRQTNANLGQSNWVRSTGVWAKLDSVSGTVTTAGYGLGLYAVFPSTLYAAFMLPTGATLLGTRSINTWYSMRMEVYPIGTAADRIRCFQESSPGSGTWNLIHDVTISSSSGSYIAWGGSRVIGTAFHDGAGDGGSGHVDLFSASLAVAP